MNVARYTESWKRTWDHFAWKGNEGTLFHTRRFLSYHPEGRFEDHSLIFHEGDRLVAILPAMIRRDKGSVLVSHAGASYGGFVCREDLSIQTAFTLVEELLNYAVKQGWSRIEMTPPPAIYQSRPNDYMSFALYKHAFHFGKREVSSVVPLDFSTDDILNIFKPESRTAYRRSVKLRVSVRESDDFTSFYPILEKNLAMRHNVRPTHTLEELYRLKRLFPENIRQFEALLDRQVIAGVTQFLCNDRVMLAFYISHDPEYQRFRPVNHLFYEIMKWGIRRKVRFLDFGIFTVNEEPNWGLGKFKESFGARGIFRDTLCRDL